MMRKGCQISLVQKSHFLQSVSEPDREQKDDSAGFHLNIFNFEVFTPGKNKSIFGEFLFECRFFVISASQIFFKKNDVKSGKKIGFFSGSGVMFPCIGKWFLLPFFVQEV